MQTLARSALIAVLGVCLTGYGAMAAGLGGGGGGGHGGGGMGGGGGGHAGGMGGGHGMGSGAGLSGGAMNRGAGGLLGAGRQNFAAGHRVGGGRIVRGGGYGLGYGAGDPSYVYGDNEQDPETGRSAAETGDVCATPVTACQMSEEAYVGQACACRTSNGRSLGRVTQ